MVFREVYDAFKDLFYSWYETGYELVLGERKKQQVLYIKIALFSIALLIVAAKAFFLYHWYVEYREQSAQKMLAQSLKEYYKAAKTNSVEDWDAVAALCKVGYEQHANSYIAPYFLAYQAEALIQQHKLKDALPVLEQVFLIMSEKSPLFFLFKLKYALVHLDIPQYTQTGLQELIELARNEKNPYHDTALFYLGNYYWVQDQMQEAKKVWQELIDTHWQQHMNPSPWVGLVQEKLKQIS
jgi:hypothetical protein